MWARRLLLLVGFSVAVFDNAQAQHHVEAALKRFELGMQANFEAIRTWNGTAKFTSVLTSLDGNNQPKDVFLRQRSIVEFAVDNLSNFVRWNITSAQVDKGHSSEILKSHMIRDDEYYVFGPVNKFVYDRLPSFAVCYESASHEATDMFCSPMYFLIETEAMTNLKHMADTSDRWTEYGTSVDFDNGKLTVQVRSGPYSNLYEYEKASGYNLVHSLFEGDGKEGKVEWTCSYEKKGGAYVPKAWEYSNFSHRQKRHTRWSFVVEEQRVNQKLREGEFTLAAMGVSELDGVKDTIRGVDVLLKYDSVNKINPDVLVPVYEVPRPKKMWLFVAAISAIAVCGLFAFTWIWHIKRP